MNEAEIKILSEYAKSQARNKIVFCKDTIPDILPLNLGKSLSESILRLDNLNKLPMKITSEIDQLLKDAVVYHENFGNLIFIQNVGILFEPELKLNFVSFLDNYSQNNVLMMQWEGETDTDNLYFLSKEEGIKINIKHLSHITI